MMLNVNNVTFYTPIYTVYISFSKFKHICINWPLVVLTIDPYIGPKVTHKDEMIFYLENYLTKLLRSLSKYCGDSFR